ncbi:MAG: NTP transferase domain-containing protein [Acidobacteria bacterium]|nr:NTP transferase domain-containing protein [Acidobacteriota bacterium]
MSILCEQTPVVILAGGKGTRLMPYTTSLPKPLMPVGEYPILEILLRQLATQGFRNITLAVGHLAGLIQAYFKDGEDWGLDIKYSYETTPLGTAGPIAKLPRYERAMLVLNGDLLTSLDFAKVVRFHYENNSIATIGTKRRIETVHFGVVEKMPNGHIVQYREKPSLDYLVSMGVYVFSAVVREFIPRSQKFDFPELVQRLLANGKKVLAYESEAYWMDIGRPDDYEKANQDFPNMEKLLLKAHVESAAVGARI